MQPNEKLTLGEIQVKTLIKEKLNWFYKGPTLNICKVLMLIFIILKLCNVITLSWWFLLLPITIVVIVAMIIGLVVIIKNSDLLQNTERTK